MTKEEVKPFLSNYVRLVIPHHRRTSLSIYGVFVEAENTQSGEMEYQVTTDGPICAMFPLNDISTIEKSVNKGIVVRLTN